jgi:micrococcal nuclease
LPRSLSHRRKNNAGKIAGIVIPVVVLLFAGGIVLARMVAPSDAPLQVIAETPTETETTTATEPTTAPTETTPTPFVPSVALPAKKLDGVDLTKATRATVTEVIDGDTFKITPPGGSTGPDLADLTVRFYGINAPETYPANKTEKCGPEASEQLKVVLKPGTEVLLLSDKRDKDRFDRLLRYVFLPDGTSLDAGMVTAGLAKAWTSDGTYKKQIKDMEDDASLHSRGCLWASGQ